MSGGMSSSVFTWGDAHDSLENLAVIALVWKSHGDGNIGHGIFPGKKQMLALLHPETAQVLSKCDADHLAEYGGK